MNTTIMMKKMALRQDTVFLQGLTLRSTQLRNLQRPGCPHRFGTREPVTCRPFSCVSRRNDKKQTDKDSTGFDASEHDGPVRIDYNIWREKMAEQAKLKNEPPASVAIVGGGITGLSAAYYIANFAPKTHVTIYEASDRFGGWLRSVPVKLPDGGEVLFEQGPRTLRPATTNGIVMLDLIRLLGLEKDLSLVPKTSASAQNRYIYYPDKLVKLPNSVPSMIRALFNEPLLKGSLRPILAEIFRKRRDASMEDESIGSFISRRLSPKLTENVVSAVLHGIYAGDVDKLSSQMILTRLFRYEEKYGSIFRGAMRSRQEELVDDKIVRQLLSGRNLPLMKIMKDTSVYTFKKGISQISDALESSLSVMPNVTLLKSKPVKRVLMNEDKSKAQVYTSPSEENSTSLWHDFVLSTVFAPLTASFLPTGTSPELASVHAVTVMVVNLYFPTPKLDTAPRGFGYLIPKSVPREQNPEYALGVIFDSDSQLAQDLAPGEKLTVMLGGHWWDGRQQYPSNKEGVELALSLLRRHKIITEDAHPTATWVSLQKDCIPQYEVGYAARLRQVHEDLMDKMGGRVVLAGNSYGGVGLNDCVRSARDAALAICEADPTTGLENFAYEQVWVNTGAP